MPSVILLLSLHLPVSAFAPEGAAHQGMEPQRLQVTHPRVQAALTSSAPWQAFLAAEGPGWRVLWDESLRAPRRVQGSGVPMPSHAPEEAVIRWLERHADLFGIERNGLSVRHVGRTADTVYVDLDAPIAGLPVWRGGVTARIKHGRLIDVGLASYPGVPVTGAHRLTGPQAITRARDAGPASSARHTDISAQRMLLPQDTPDGVQLTRVWVVRSTTADPVGRWVAFVDGASGEVLSVHNEVRFFDGQVLAEHDLRNPFDGRMAISPAPFVEVAGVAGELATADASGFFTLPTAAPELVTDLTSGSVRVRNDLGDEGVLSGPGPELLWTEADATLAEIDAYVFLHHARDWGRIVAPDNAMVGEPVTAHVNIDMACNAYFDGNVNFFVAGQGCNNTARIADVVYHEWGHGFHLESLQSSWLGFDGALSEGAADTVSFLMTGDPIIAPGFFTNGQGIRNVDNDNRYPEDFVSWDVHTSGLIFGGSMWDLWNLLKASHGEVEGTAKTEAIFAGLLAGGPDIPTAYDEALVADDDNGDLSDGTPNQCALLTAFGAHGLGPLGATGSPYLATHTSPPAVPANAPHPVRFDLDSVARDCFPYDPVSGTLHLRVDGGAWETAPVTLDDDGAEGLLPPLPYGSFVEYWLEVLDASGATFRGPTGGAIHPYTTWVGGTLDVWCADFEADDAGFKHRLVDGSSSEGADDWQWGKPNGQSGDPSSAASGNKVWGNDLGYDNFNGAYQDAKHNRLRSPPLELGHYEGVFLRYARWLRVEDGVYDEAWIEADGEVVWTNHASRPDLGTEHHLDDEWMTHVVSLGDTTADGEVQLAWHLRSDAALSFGGWTIDDVCLVAPDTPNNRLAIVDLEAVPGEGEVALSWTNPRHAPVSEVVVVRRFDRFPEGADDGDVVFRSEAPAVGEPDHFVHDVEPGGYYAVYGGDGTSWLGWTIEGWNAANVGPVAWLDPDGQERVTASAGELRGGCGCDSAPIGVPWISLLIVPLARRRRR